MPDTKRKQNQRQEALDYHEFPKPGKLELTATKQMVNQHDLALAYSPGVAAPCEEIAKDPLAAYKYTARGNLVAVISNGTAVLGLGDIGPLASKPVMEGKAVLFKKFANIDVFDIEVNEKDPEKLVDIIAALEPTFGGINLEDISAPECFYVERKLRERLNIPVFHDDQHGTAIVVGAAALNGLTVLGKDIKNVKLVASGAGAAAIACLDLLVQMGMRKENITVCDGKGVIYKGRENVPVGSDKERYATDTDARTIADALPGADMFLGLSVGGIVTGEMIKTMAPNPLVMALANPTPEVLPEEVLAVRDDAVIATGRSDYPNQVNNVLCFPYMFRGALDCGASTITVEMGVAAVKAIAELARAEQNEVVAAAYAGENLTFGKEYLIPKPFDPRLMEVVAPAVAKAAMDAGIASRPIEDFNAYRHHLRSMVLASGATMKPIIDKAQNAKKKRIAFSEGEEERILRAAQIVADENLARPTLIGRPDIISKRIEKFGLRLKEGVDYDVVNVEYDERYKGFWQEYHRMTERKGVTVQMAKIEMRRRLVLIGSMLLNAGDVDGLVCGTWGNTHMHLQYIDQVIGKSKRASDAQAQPYACMNALVLPDRQIFVADTHVNYDPTAEELAEITIMAAEEVSRFGIEPKVALVSHSNFGSSDNPSAVKLRQTLRILRERAPELQVEGEMHGDLALDPEARAAIMPNNVLEGEANLLILPNIDAANATYNLLKTAAGSNIAIGPMLLGCAKPVNILTPSSTVRRIVNVAALTVVEANADLH